LSEPVGGGNSSTGSNKASEKSWVMPLRAQLKLLIVDDTSTSRALLRSGLDELGLTNLAFAVDGADAIKHINANPPNLIISDLNMPNLDGLGLLKAIRSYPPTSKVGFIMLTGNSDKAAFAKATQLGVNNYLMKPFTTASLKASIEAVVGRLQ
jgi:two-component system, chemotaxis family, chemotaxis protein CheY